MVKKKKEFDIIEYADLGLSFIVLILLCFCWFKQEIPFVDMKFIQSLGFLQTSFFELFDLSIVFGLSKVFAFVSIFMFVLSIAVSYCGIDKYFKSIKNINKIVNIGYYISYCLTLLLSLITIFVVEYMSLTIFYYVALILGVLGLYITIKRK